LLFSAAGKKKLGLFEFFAYFQNSFSLKLKKKKLLFCFEMLVSICTLIRLLSFPYHHPVLVLAFLIASILGTSPTAILLIIIIVVLILASNGDVVSY